MTRRKPIDDAPQQLENTWKSPVVGAVLIILLTVVAYLPVLRCGYIWDDDAYVTQNPLLTAPDGLEHIWFSAHRQSQYFPLVFTTLRFEHTLWGLDPVGYHSVNLLLHCINALLVWIVLRKLALPGAWLAAAIWAVHPVNVESVAWITELKNTQSTLFYLLALVAWMKFTDQQTGRPWRFYGLAFGLQTLALFSKTTACTLPAAMLLVLWLRKELIGWRRLMQVAPFMGLGVAMGLLSVWWEAHLGNYGEQLDYSFNGLDRVLIATHALWFYATKLVWPTNLAFSYPRWEIDPRNPLQYTWLVGCVAIAMFLWRHRRALGRAPAAAVVFFVAALSPLLGFIPLYTFRYAFVADHYQYVASIALIALFAGAVSSQAVTWQLGHNLRCTLSAALLLVLGALTWQQTRIYQDSETLWRDTFAKNAQCWMAHNNLGSVFLKEGEASEAIGQFEQAVRIKPDYAEGHNNLGVALVRLGRIQEAVVQYEQALRIKPADAKAHYNLGVALAQTGRIEEAIIHYGKSLQIDPTSAEAHYSLANALLALGKVPEAVAHYQQALAINPKYAEAHSKFGAALIVVDKAYDARGQLEEALRIKPDLAEAQNNLAWVLATLPPAQGGDPVRAVALAQRACELSGNRAPGDLDTLAVAYAAAGQFSEAVATARKAIDLARAAGQPGLVKEIAARLELYRSGRAYSESTAVTSPGNR
ncbi:MAG: tetratricopeptide repeat protein [Verrucomicrobiia bacterium]|jgi:tetratricopeptide (TPR) repeat protein